ncbi:MAG TPA: carbohydrate ABC transporter permease [Caldilineaceae bacterium]|nr:carbohydrate ABC transporter permease [Caldilineaceae bacterium]
MTTRNTALTTKPRQQGAYAQDGGQKWRALLIGNRFMPGLLRQFVVYSLLVLLAALFLLPFYWMVNTALKPVEQVFTLPPTWVPNPVRWANFVEAMIMPYEASPPVYIYAINTSLITFNGVVATLLSSAMVAYAFARLEFPGKNVLFLGILSTLMIPFAVVMVPQFIVWKNLNWLDTLWPLMIPHWFGSAWNIFLLRQFFMSIPREYDEAALMDGASRWGIFWRIILPLAKPALAAVGVFAFVFFWNDFLGPLIILSTPKNFTLTIYLANFQVAYARTTQWNLYMAAALIIILPCLVLFFFSQNAFLKGITISDFKR